MLQVYELAEKVALIAKPAGPLEIQDSDALANCKVAAIREEEGGILVLHGDTKLGYLMQHR